jgi:hypothetical protein
MSFRHEYLNDSEREHRRELLLRHARLQQLQQLVKTADRLAKTAVRTGIRSPQKRKE